MKEELTVQDKVDRCLQISVMHAK